MTQWVIGRQPNPHSRLHSEWAAAIKIYIHLLHDAIQAILKKSGNKKKKFSQAIQ